MDMEAAIERALVDRLKRGEIAAFDEIYDALRPQIFSFLARLSKQRALAEELLQETFVRLAKKAPALDADTRLLPFLYTVARNLYVSHRRMTMIEGDGIDRLSLEETTPVATPFELAAANETRVRLERAIAVLPDTYREVILLVAVAQLEPAEAAKVVGIAPEALRQRLSRARGLLKAALDEETSGRRSAS
jgi:RNA polymerase sigma-70 factor (ECF subfamily)